jgi:Fe-S cluster biogenesis protein NfuA
LFNYKSFTSAIQAQENILSLLQNPAGFETASIEKTFHYWLYYINRNHKEFMMFEEQVKSALDNVRPSLQADGGDVEFVSVADDGTVSVKLTGACGGCPMAQMTLKMGIENYLKKEVPQVTSVVGV